VHTYTKGRTLYNVLPHSHFQCKRSHSRLKQATEKYHKSRNYRAVNFAHFIISCCNGFHRLGETFDTRQPMSCSNEGACLVWGYHIYQKIWDTVFGKDVTFDKD